MNHEFPTKENLKVRCDWLLTILFGRDSVEQWWDTTIGVFDNETPRTVFDSDPHRVYNYLMRITE